MGFFQNVNAYRIGECRTSSDKKHLYMYEKTGWREVAGTRRKKQWIDAVNNRVYMKSRRGFWNAYEFKIYIASLGIKSNISSRTYSKICFNNIYSTIVV